ncbi:MAG: beta-ketoacyl-[acyl-carrier-protein] synthase II, partial [Candidatus Omnitrophica bacterium]|nr:beta-ketoacyl-[acyl-carrier-protein] synthase II [Candidatus Omnitrophota bacterium]
MNEKRVVITGIGVVSPVGTGRKAFWEALKKGASGIKPVTLFDVSKTDSKLAGEISDFDPELILGAKGLRNLDRLTKLALCAAKLALDDAGYAVTDENAHRTGVVFGTTGGSIA